MEKYICKMCGHVYDPVEGDSIGGIERGTKFEDLPDKWCHSQIFISGFF